MTGNGFVSRGHAAIAPFALSRPTPVAAALDRLGAGATAHAGGVDVVAALRNGARVDELVHLGGIEQLQTIGVDPDGGLHIGAGVTHHRMETDPNIVETRPDLAAAWRTVGNARIRRAGTVGGNLLAFDPGYDAAPILAAAGARLHWDG
ncbi:MAG: FAD binding domain-containing protein, partial [Actinomycetota bacterium]